MPPKTQVNSATGIMGPSGSGKSCLLATYAKYVWRRWHKVTLYYTSDGGGFPAEVQACIAAGIMRAFRMYTRDTPEGDLSFETCQRAAQGWWPKRINPSTGEVPPGVEMVPPIAQAFEMRCPTGHVLKTVPSQSLLIPTLCPICKTMIGKGEMRVQKTLTRTPGFEDVGAVCYDGLTSMLAWELRDMGHRSGRLELKGEEGSIGGKVVSGDLKFGGSTRSHVGFVQARGEELVHLTLGIPNLVVPPLFTMLTHEDVDERSLSIRGPKISGRAKTDEAPQWFGNMLEAAKIPALQGSGEQRVLYLSEFTDDRGVRHLCKHRGSPGTMPAYLIDPVEDPAHPELAFTQFNLGVFFEMLDGALERRIADVRLEFPDAPGVPEGWVEIGGSVVVPGPTTTGEGEQPTPIPSQYAPTGVAFPPSPPLRSAAPAAPSIAPRRRVRPGAPPAPPAAVPTLPPAPVEAATAEPVVPPASTAPAPPAPPAPPATPVPSSVAVAPPAGRRPTPARSPAGTPAGVVVNGPTVARPVQVAPRAPAAAPRPPVSPSQPTLPGTGPASTVTP